MAQIRLVKVFLASPGDVAREGEMVREALDAINRRMGEEKGVRFEVVNWKTDSFPAYGGDGQALLNAQIAEMSKYDLFVGIMWNRFGTATPRANSGTEEEFLRAVESFERNGNPQIMFYFNQAPASFASPRDAEQKLKVLQFREQVQQKGLTHDYNGAENFQQAFRNHIESWLVRESPKKLEPPRVDLETTVFNEKPEQKPSFQIIRDVQVINDSEVWVLLNNGFYRANEVSELGENKVLLKLPVGDAADDAAFRSLQPNRYGGGDPIPFAHQNTGAIARVTEAKRTSANNQNFWELQLKLDENNSSFYSEVNYNGVSADKLAELRARFILLNENPTPAAADSRLNLNDNLFAAFVTGINSRVRVEGSVLPDLWRNTKGDVEVFLPFARLWSVFHLITSNTCQYVLDLTLGPVTGDKLRVKFRGQRHKIYSNVEPHIISFEGDCNLDPK